MHVCPKHKGIHCPLFDDDVCSVPAEQCIFIETYECTCSHEIELMEMRKKFDTLVQASQKVFRQFGITFDIQ